MFTMRVRLGEAEPFEVEAISPDIVAWEALGRANKRPTPRRFGDLDDGLMMTDLAELAWFACERTGVAGLPDRPTFVRSVPIELVGKAKDGSDDGDEDGEEDGPLVPGRADR